jgi:hypothetical protein
MVFSGGVVVLVMAVFGLRRILSVYISQVGSTRIQPVCRQGFAST